MVDHLYNAKCKRDYAAAQTEEQPLQDQYSLAFSVYNGVIQQLEQSRIKVQEETPVLKMLEPVSIPVERSKPKREMVIMISVFLGLAFGVASVFGLSFIKKLNSNRME